MSEEKNNPKTLMQAVSYFSKGDNAHNFMVNLRWPDGKVCCPRCGTDAVRAISTRKTWECKKCTTRKQFSVKVGTIFEDSPIKLDKWLAALWLIANAKNGISSYEIHRSLGVTQKTGWFMLHRIRLAMQTGSIVKDQMGGVVEVDESYIGGLARKMNNAQRKRTGIIGTGGANKTAVMGLLERGAKGTSRVHAEVIPRAKGKVLMPLVRKYVLKGSELHTDQNGAYSKAREDFNHKVVDHAQCYVKDGVHTNGLENFWSLLKRGIRGTYVSVEPFHLFRYLSEQVFRFNERKDNDQERFFKVAGSVFGKRVTYSELIGAGKRLPA